MPANRRPIEGLGPRNRCHRLVYVLYDKAGYAVVDDFWHCTSPKRDYGSRIPDRLDEHETEWLGPIDRKQQGDRFAVKCPLFVISDLTDELYPGSFSIGLILASW